MIPAREQQNQKTPPTEHAFRHLYLSSNKYLEAMPDK